MLPKDLWIQIAQALAGLFFMGAGLFKLENYFLLQDQSLAGHFQFWLDNGWPPHWFGELMSWGKTYEKPLAAMTISFQILPGLLFVTNRGVRVAALLLLWLQLLIYMGTYNHLGFNEFVGLSLWICLFYALKPADSINFRSQWHWSLVTSLLFYLALLHLFNRYLIGDPWLSSVDWQRENLTKDVMSISIGWKESILALSQGEVGKFLWAGAWWGELLLVLLLLTPLRLAAAGGLMLYAIMRVLTWMNTATSHSVLWVLVLFLWMTEEELLRRTVGTHSLLPVYLRSIKSVSTSLLHPVRTARILSDYFYKAVCSLQNIRSLKRN